MSKSTKRLRFAVSAAVIVAGLALVGGLLQAMTGVRAEPADACSPRQIVISEAGAIISPVHGDSYLVASSGSVSLVVYMAGAKPGTRFSIKDISLSDHEVEVVAMGGAMLDGVDRIILTANGRGYVQLEFDGVNLWVVGRG